MTFWRNLKESAILKPERLNNQLLIQLEFMPKKGDSFVLNDENELNSYGFRTSNEGLNLDRFKDNPVLLDYHRTSNESVIGRWTNIRIEGSLLLADPEFDIEDPAALKVKGKVDRGFIKGASMGLTFSHKNMEIQPDGTYLLGKSQLMEGSIVSIPSNRKSLKLYTEDGDLMTEESVKLSIKQISKPKIDMPKVALSFAALTALGLQSDEDSVALSAAVEKLAGEKTSLTAKLKAKTSELEALESKVEADNDAKALSMVKNAITEGKITADKKEKFLKIAKADFTLAADFLSEIPAKKTLAGEVINSTSGGDLPKTMDEFEKLSTEKKLSFQADHPAEFEKLFTQN
ncbi:caudovirus prohead protease [Brumimicrobium mesophilum]|uniref:caudovirus prohead protease n=1 Tax=Brumimicrobium mesophilum TaxID=392717 RepID=UPI000D14475E|nr:caudovirus prohead protease [Brumimicrobium mesophilum]